MSIAIAICQLLASETSPPAIPPAADHKIDFHKEVAPILASTCVKCHANAKHEGGFSIEDRAAVLKGGDTGATVVPGKSEESLLIRLVSGLDSDRVMPAKGPRLTPDQIGVLRAWIDQGLPWEPGFTFHRAPAAPLHLRRPTLPPAAANGSTNPIDLLLGPFFASNHVSGVELAGNIAGDRTFIRRVSLDLIGLLPEPEQVEKFVADTSPDKRERLVERLLADNERYAEHWMTFWNDALRNAYRGTGYIDGGRTQISAWLYQSLYWNMPYDEFVRDLIDPKPESAGFIRGVVWRGVVNASQVPAMQAAQNVSQVFMGINLKCASCHDSFINDWTLNDSYGLAGIFSDTPLEVHRCDKPTGKFAPMKFLYPELGAIDAKAPREKRLGQLARAITSPEDGRFARTIVNHLWAQMLGRGLIEPVDDMDQGAWNADLLDWLAADLVDHHFDLKRTLKVICTSRAYAMRSVGARGPAESGFVFRGPLVQRMTAEQFIDGVFSVTGVWPHSAAFQSPRPTKAEKENPIRAVFLNDDALSRALGRTDREQVLTHRDNLATTLQTLELTNGTTLDDLVKQGARKWLDRKPKSAAVLIDEIYRRALCRAPTKTELAAATGFIGSDLKPEPVEDFLWAMFMLPEFQLIH
ncbi:MAG TPA: PSD1 and planctomycete cytochrome C domain-containing protein [Pirellulales bacterium]|nr:PSD1 and planctomycete cytochrome C domain-containing protein [Pirellulales bacterium]